MERKYNLQRKIIKQQMKTEIFLLKTPKQFEKYKEKLKEEIDNFERITTKTPIEIIATQHEKREVFVKIFNLKHPTDALVVL